MSAAVALSAAALLLIRGSAGGEELLVNGGFEDGTNGWSVTDGQVAASDIARTGEAAGQFTAGDDYPSEELFQWVAVQPDATYQFDGWVNISDATIDRVFLIVRWFDASLAPFEVSYSPWLVGSSPSYRYVSTGLLTSPPGAAHARVAVVVHSHGPFSILADDFSFDGPPGATPSPSPSAPATAAATVPPSATARPPTATATAHPTFTPAPSATPTPTASPTPVAEPAVFESLTNGGFEAARDDGSAYGWQKIGGSIERVTEPRAGGAYSLQLSSRTASTKWAYQTVRVQPGGWYEARAMAWKDDANAAAAFLRVSWYTSADGSGEAIGSVDSAGSLETDTASFRELSAGPLQAPPGAETAKVRLMLRPAGSDAAAVHFDDVTFGTVPAPSATPTATPSAAPTVSPTATQQSSPTTAPSPATSATPSATPAETPAPTPTPSATPEPSPAPSPEEPGVFSALTNGGFEEAREDGTPYAWRKVGGETAVTGMMRAEGDAALEIVSATDSTKWAHQAVVIQPGAYFEATAMAYAGPGAELFLRVSWYTSEDGSGPAIASDDSAATTSGSGFERLSTGAVQAPGDARSARLRLMLRPDSSARATGYFDDARFSLAAAPADNGDDPDGPVSTPRPASAGSNTRTPSASGSATEPEPTPAAAVAGARRGPVSLANVRPAAGEAPQPVASEGDGGTDRRWWMAGALLVPVLGFAAIGGREAWARWRRSEP